MKEEEHNTKDAMQPTDPELMCNILEASGPDGQPWIL